MIRKFDEGIIKAYKHMLIDKLKNPEDWGTQSTKRRGKEEIGTEFSVFISPISFYLNKDNTVDVKINSNVVYVFNKLNNLDLIPRILYFRRMKRHAEINKEIRSMEKRMKDALPDDYKRAIKISKIRENI